MKTKTIEIMMQPRLKAILKTIERLIRKLTGRLHQSWPTTKPRISPRVLTSPRKIRSKMTASNQIRKEEK